MGLAPLSLLLFKGQLCAASRGVSLCVLSAYAHTLRQCFVEERKKGKGKRRGSCQLWIGPCVTSAHWLGARF